MESRPVDLLGIFCHRDQEQLKIPELLTRAAETNPDLAGDAPMAARDLNLRLGKEAVAPDLAQGLIAHADELAGDAGFQCTEVFPCGHVGNCAGRSVRVQREEEMAHG